MTNSSQHAKGLTLTALGVLILSPDALLVRLIETDLWTLLFWRGSLMGFSLLAFVFLSDFKKGVRNLKSLSKLGWISTLLFSMNNILFMVSITNTTAANTLAILGALPLFSAILGYLLIKERLPLNTWIAIFLGFCGILVIFMGSFQSKGFFGDMAAACCACSMAGALICFRHDQTINSVLAIGLGSLLSAVFAIFLAEPFNVTGDAPYLILLLGMVVLPLSMGLITIGPKYISAAEVSLILITEMAIGPLWVWIGTGEAPSLQTVFGGAIILTTMVVHSIVGLRQSRA